MEGSKAEVSRLCNSKSYFYGLHIPQLTKQNNIWVLPQHMLQCLFKAAGIRANLSLVHEGLFRWMEILDRIFNCYDVVFPFLVYLVYHRSKGCGLAAACRACHKDKPTRLFRKFLYDRRQTQFLKCFYLKRNRPENTPCCPPLNKQI